MIHLKRRYWFLLALGALIVLLAAGASVLLETQAGLRWAVHMAESYSGGMVKVDTASGRLAGPFSLDRVRITVPGVEIDVRHVEIDWHPSGLLAGQVRVSTLEGQGIVIRPREASPANAVAAASASSPTAVLPPGISLPLHIHVTRARLRDVDWKGPNRTLHLDRLDFSADADSRTLRVARLTARSPRLALSGTARAAPHGRWAVHADLSVQVQPEGYPEIAGRTVVEGALGGTLRLHQTLDRPFPADLRARITDLFGTPHGKGTLQLARLDPHRINALWPRLEAGANLAFAGGPGHFTIHGTLNDKRILPRRQVRINLAGGLDGDTLRLDHLDLALGGSPTRLTVRGTLGLRPPYRADATLAWQALQWPLDAARPMASAPSGGAHLQGTPTDWALELRTLVRARGTPQGRLALSLHGNRQRIDIGALAATWLDGTLAGSGRLGVEGKMPFRLSLRGRGLDLAGVSRHIAGKAGFDLQASGGLAPLRGRMKLTHLSGEVRGHALSGHAAVAYAGQVLDVQALKFAAGDNSFAASGRWGRTLLLDWRFDAPKLGEIAPGLQGHVQGHGRFAGTLAKPHVKADLQAADLKWKSLGLGQARLQADLEVGPKPAGSLQLHAEHITRGALEISRVEALLEGPASRQTFALAVASNRGDIELSGTGRLEKNRWRGQLVSSRLQPLKAAAFQLESPAALELGAGGNRLARSCWHDPRGRGFCLSGHSRAASWGAELSLDALPLTLANAYLDGSTVLEGSLDGYLKASGGGKQALALVGEMHSGAGSVTRDVAGKAQHFAFSEAGLEARFDGTLAQARLGIVLEDGSMLDTALDVPWRNNTQPTGDLKLVAHLKDLSGIGALTPALGNVKGRMDADFEVHGSLDAPHFKGYLQVSGFWAHLTRFGTRITRSELRVQGAGKVLKLKGELHDAKKGRLGIDGTLAHDAQWQLDARIEGKGFHAANIPEAHATVSPDITLKVRDHAITVNGSVVVPEAEIQPPHFSGAVSPSPDLVVVGRSTRKATPWTVTASLTIKLGEHVHFSGYGLSARMGGGLTIHDSPGELTTASGEIKILDGEYKAYGQDLTIQRGRVLFSGGPISNPGLDIRAVRTVGAVTAGLQVTGTLRNPSLQVFSDPPMSRSNALAYLLFGHGMEQTTGSEQSTVNQAANALGIAGGTYLAKAVGKSVGIDTVSVENASPYETSANQASLFLGKYLSPRLYVSYGIGIYQPINLLRIRYTLSRHWALEAESGTFSGADILYTIGH